MRALSVFSGAGGLDVGVTRSGRFDLVGCVDNDPVSCRSLRSNLDVDVLESDLSTLSARELMSRYSLGRGELPLLIGGPPCQSFSTAGRRKSVADPRGTLLWDFLRLVHDMQPRYFLIENVRGLLSAALRHRPIAERPDKGGPPLASDELPGSVFESWVADLPAGYRVDVFEVNAVNYGAPQLRERVLIFGTREDKSFNFPPPTHGIEGTPFVTLGQALEGFHEDEPEVLDFSPRKKMYLQMVPPGGNWRSLPDEIAQESMGRAYFSKGGRSGWWRRLSWHLPCPTITTMPNHASTSMCHPDEVRALSVGECARIQGFPEGWSFSGSVQDKMRQVGNAVPVRLGEVAADVLWTAMQSAPVAGLPVSRRTYLSSHVRTRRWYQEGRAVVEGVF